MATKFDNITAIILAGGQGRRMNMQDKGLIQIGNDTLVSRLIKTLSPQVNEIIINANRNLDQYRNMGLKIVSDERQDFQGPLSGIASTIKQVTTELVLIVPCDSPFIPQDLIDVLTTKMTNEIDIVVVNDGERLQPLFMLARKSIGDSLEQYLEEGGRKVQQWLSTQSYISADFSSQHNAFFNINTPDDLNIARNK